MTKKSHIQRRDILALNLKELKRALPNVSQTKLVVLEEDSRSQPLPQHIVKPWVISLSDQVFVSRNKICHGLLQHCRHGFILDDPYIRESRFFVDYHRLHDPGLKRYYNSIPVRNRLEELNLVTSENDAECTPKEFAEYLKYLERNLDYRLLRSSELEVMLEKIYVNFGSVLTIIVAEFLLRNRDEFPIIFKNWKTSRNMNRIIREFSAKKRFVANQERKCPLMSKIKNEDIHFLFNTENVSF